MFALLSLVLTTIGGQSLYCQAAMAAPREPLPIILAASDAKSAAKAERSAAWLAHMQATAKSHQDKVASVWFRSWRMTAVANQYLATAETFEEMATEIGYEDLTDCQNKASRIAGNYRAISEMMLLGGSETVNDGTGHYTVKIAELIERNAKLMQTPAK